MIIGQINGGLGNQMFQYAFYKYLQVVKSTSLYLDTARVTLRQAHNGYELSNIFSIAESEANLNDVKAFKTQCPLMYRLQTKLFGSTPFSRSTHFRENFFNIDKTVFNPSKKDLYIEGYFQTDKYIRFLTDAGHFHFSFQETPNIHEEALLSTNSVAIHVRGGDYLSSQKSLNLYGGICDNNYYERAVDMIYKKISKPKFFLFTNDTEYAANILPNIDYTTINWNPGSLSYRDMYLMTQCKHNIIANSSFSWWGAYLNDNQEKIVISPQKWLNSDRYNQTEIVPQSWVKI